MDVLIRGLPKVTHVELARRAATEGMSLNAYLRGILEQHTAAPSMQQWLENLDVLGSIPRVRSQVRR